MVVSCERAQFLDLYPVTQISREQYYQTEEQIRLATVAAYETMNTDKAEGVFIQHGTYFGGLLGIMCAPSDEILPSRAQNNASRVTDMYRASFTESTPALRSMWDAFYIGIGRCNAVIENGKKFTSEKIKSYVAEATFMRGFYYWYLAQVFGGVPIVSYNSDGTEPRSNLETLYNYIINDFDIAYQTLPESSTEGVLGKASANKYTAAAYLGRVCNYLAACGRNQTGAEFVAEQPLNDFSFVTEDIAKSLSEKAYNCLKDVVENSGYVLIPDFRNLFRETTKEEQHKECLFMAENYISGSENIFPSSQIFGFAPGSSGDQNKGQTPTVYTGFLLSSPKIFGMFSPKDPRRDWFFTSDGTGNVNADISKGQTNRLIEEVAIDGYKYVKPFDRREASSDNRFALFVDNVQTQTYVPWQKGTGAIGKYRFAQIGQVTTHTKNDHSLSIPLMRFADVKLMYAEALHYHKNDDVSARAQLYDVLLRACDGDSVLADELSAAYSKADFVEELLDARERELCFEGSRKYDLIRFNLLDEYMTNLANNPVYTKNDVTYYEYQAWQKFGTTDYVYFVAADFTTAGETLRNNWQSYKMWAPISSIQIAANPNLKQNAKW